MYTGSNCFDVTIVKGYSLVPLPPASIIPFMLTPFLSAIPVHLFVIGLIVSAGHVGHPLLMGQIPFHSLSDPVLKGGLGFPGQLLFDLVGSNGVAPVMPLSVRYKGDEILFYIFFPGIIIGKDLPQGVQDDMYYLYILLFVMPADIVFLMSMPLQ